MKKKYIKPTMKLYNVGVRKMPCGSDPTNLTGTMGSETDSSNDPDNNLGKENDFEWDW